MNSRRARAQYGKASKRLNSRVSVEFTSTTAEKEVSKPVPSKTGVSMASRAQQSIKEAESTAKHAIDSTNARRTRSPTHPKPELAKQDSMARKRKRDPSPSSSELTDTLEEPVPKIKAVKRSSSDALPVKKAPSFGGSKVAPSVSKTPPRSTISSAALPNPPTPKLAKDLSDLFISPDKPSTSSGSPQRPGHLKRMLSKAKSGPVIESTVLPATAQLFASRTIPTPSSSPQKESSTYTSLGFNRHPLARDRTPSPPRVAPTPPPVPRSPSKVVRTYSKSRSFLVETTSTPIGVDGESPASPKKVSLEEDHDMHRESYSDLRSRWGLQQFEQDPELNTPINDLNSVSELRSRGETRRFLDEVSYLLDGLDSSSGKVNTAIRRATAIEIVSKLGDSEFFRRAAAADFIGKAWSALRNGGAGSGDDKILDCALIAFVAVVSKDPRQAMDLSRTKDLLPFLAVCLGVHSGDDILIAPPQEQETIWVRKQGLSKVDRTSLTALRDAIEKGRVLRHSIAPSHRLLASESLSRISEYGRSLENAIFEATVDSLVSELSDLPGSEDDRKSYSFRHLTNCLHIAEAYHTKSHGSSGAYTKLAIPLAQYVNSWPRYLTSTHLGIDETFIITLRYLVTISHDESSVCETLVTTSDFLYNLLRVLVFWHWKYFDDLSTHTNLVAKNEDESESIQPAEVLEKVSLSLGLMSQLIKNNDAAKETLRGINLSPCCPAADTCTEMCQCTEQVSGVRVLVYFFNKPMDDLNEATEAQAHFVRGNIAVVLGILSAHSKAIRADVLGGLESASSEDQKLWLLIDAIRDFGSLLSDVVRKAGQGEQAEENNEAQSVTGPVGRNEITGPLDEAVQLALDVAQKLESLLSRSVL